MDRINRLRAIETLAQEVSEIFHKSGWLKDSLKSSVRRPGIWFEAGSMVGVGKVVRVSVGGNQTGVRLGVSVAGWRVEVIRGAGNKPLQAVRNTSRNIPRRVIVSFIG
jgi:hypothetical protein